MNNIESLVAAIEGDRSGMSHADLVMTCKMLESGRELFRKEAEESKKQIEVLKVENAGLKNAIVRCKSDWRRVIDFCKAANGPGEFFRLQESVKDAKSNADVFVKYIGSLRGELEKLKGGK